MDANSSGSIRVHLYPFVVAIRIFGCGLRPAHGGDQSSRVAALGLVRLFAQTSNRDTLLAHLDSDGHREGCGLAQDGTIGAPGGVGRRGIGERDIALALSTVPTTIQST